MQHIDDHVMRLQGYYVDGQLLREGFVAIDSASPRVPSAGNKYVMPMSLLPFINVMSAASCDVVGA
jgi:hypothetical protein